MGNFLFGLLMLFLLAEIVAIVAIIVWPVEDE